MTPTQAFPKDLIAIQSFKGYKCLICCKEGKVPNCFRPSSFPRHLKAKHQLRLGDVEDAILADPSVKQSKGFVCPKCHYFGTRRFNYIRHCQKTCNIRKPKVVLQQVEILSTGHLHRVIGKSGNSSPNNTDVTDKPMNQKQSASNQECNNNANAIVPICTSTPQRGTLSNGLPNADVTDHPINQEQSTANQESDDANKSIVPICASIQQGVALPEQESPNTKEVTTLIL